MIQPDKLGLGFCIQPNLMIKIQVVEAIPCEGFESLRQESEKEGYRFLGRLEDDWGSDKNRFSKKGEALFKVIYLKELVGIGGITRDPYVLKEDFGRIRRFYVKPKWRRKGIGQLLLEHIITNQSGHFKEISLRTDTDSASQFYEKNGFERVLDKTHQTHRLRLTKLLKEK